MNRTQNMHIRDSIKSLSDCYDHLQKRGHTILKCSIGSNKPVVWIQYTPLCEGLKGTSMVRRQREVRESVMVALIKGCQVQWTAPEMWRA